MMVSGFGPHTAGSKAETGAERQWQRQQAHSNNNNNNEQASGQQLEAGRQKKKIEGKEEPQTDTAAHNGERTTRKAKT